jgi:hypothetical protein
VGHAATARRSPNPARPTSSRDELGGSASSRLVGRLAVERAPARLRIVFAFGERAVTTRQAIARRR